MTALLYRLVDHTNAILYSSSGQDAENLICITEDKPQRNVIEGFAQNIVQLESSYETNKRKRKRDDGDDFDYLYGIVTTARDWHFYTPGKISQGS